jgi:para-aminobenzoate synthetase component 1
MHREIANLTTVEALERLAPLPGCLLLDSAKQMVDSSQQPLGRYSFLMADPFETVVEAVGGTSPLSTIDKLLERCKVSTIAGLPPMQGGVAGLFSYDLNRSLETLPSPAHDEFQMPAIVAGAYDVVIAWDHLANKTWIISQGFPESETIARERRATQRADYFEQLLLATVPTRDTTTKKQIPTVDVAQQFSLNHPSLDRLTSNFSKSQYIDTVQKCIDYIVAGDVFQINLAQRLLHPAETDSLSLYRRLRNCNPAPFGGYFDLSSISNTDAQIVSASPERFVSVRNRIVETRPIKGTRRRTGRPMLDIRARDRLLGSEKDRAENTMIVDLMRNDLSRVCTDDSIHVDQLCELETYQSVLHLVSAVTGELQPSASLCDLFAAVFPGGSITGAPKIRAMEIISELEPSTRGAYCGSLGYLGFDGSADSNILIRTITASQGWWQIPVGGGVVVQSDPEAEYEETWTKAASMMRALKETSQPANSKD